MFVVFTVNFWQPQLQLGFIFNIHLTGHSLQSNYEDVST